MQEGAAVHRADLAVAEEAAERHLAERAANALAVVIGRAVEAARRGRGTRRAARPAGAPPARLIAQVVIAGPRPRSRASRRWNCTTLPSRTSARDRERAALGVDLDQVADRGSRRGRTRSRRRASRRRGRASRGRARGRAATPPRRARAGARAGAGRRAPGRVAVAQRSRTSAARSAGSPAPRWCRPRGRPRAPARRRRRAPARRPPTAGCRRAGARRWRGRRP